MEKEEESVLEEDEVGIEEYEISLINQLMSTVEDSYDKLERAYKKNDPETFNRLKAVLIQTQRKISEVINKNA